MPEKSMPFQIGFDMYYSKKSNSWDGSAVSFLDVSKPGKAYGKAYLIKESQLLALKTQEGPIWYPDFVLLDVIDGIEVKTLTSKVCYEKKPYSAVNKKYRNVLFDGMKETYPDMPDAEIFAYLAKCGPES